MWLLLRVNEKVKCITDPETQKRSDSKIGVVKSVCLWKGVKKGASYHIEFDADCVGQFRTDNDRHYFCRYLEVGEHVLYKKGDTAPRGGVVIKSTPWKRATERVGFTWKVKFDDDDSVREFASDRSARFLFSA